MLFAADIAFAAVVVVLLLHFIEMVIILTAFAAIKPSFVVVSFWYPFLVLRSLTAAWLSAEGVWFLKLFNHLFQKC